MSMIVFVFGDVMFVVSEKGLYIWRGLTSEFNEIVSEANDLGKMRAEHFSVKFLFNDPMNETRRAQRGKNFRRKFAELRDSTLGGEKLRKVFTIFYADCVRIN